MKNKNLITNEVAVRNEDDDLLNYYPFAKKIQQIIQGYSNNSAPLTIGIYGKWGAGKTSLLNLIEKNIEIFHKEKGDKPYIKFHYNPWIYQTKEEMLFDFFETLSRKLNYSGNENLKKAGKLIKKYSRYLKAVKLSASVGIPKLFNAGVSIEPYEILKRLGEDLEGEEKSLDELKSEIDNTLKSSNKKIIIFIDDIDRLDKDEIFTLFKLIKINADFKNLIFIVCLDPDYVAKAIHQRYGHKKKSGKEFLEKIINIPLELPLIEDNDLEYFVKEKIKPILSQRHIKKEDLDELYSSLKGHNFDSPREIIRVINSFAISFYAIGDEVNIHDLFWVEYIKIKHLKTYQVIKNYAKDIKSKQFFKSTVNFNNLYTDEKGESGLRRELLDEHKKAYSVINLLFPMEKSGTISAFQNPIVKQENVLDAELRISHINHFEKYFSFHTHGKISELSFSNFKAGIIDGKIDETLVVLKNMIENANERKVVYRITSEIEVLNEDLHDKLILFLIKNLKLFSETTDVNPHSIEIIQTIAKKIKQKPEENKEITLSLIEELDNNQLCWFLGAFRYENGVEYIKDIEKRLIDKTINSNNQPFFKNRSIAKMTMEIWSKLDFDQFQKYILNYLDTEDNIYSFFTCFPYLWNSHINGIFKDEDFEYMTKSLKLDDKVIFCKVKNTIMEINNLNELEELRSSWDDHSNNSGLDNVKQFAYWHLINEKQDEINQMTFSGQTPASLKNIK